MDEYFRLVDRQNFEKGRYPIQSYPYDVLDNNKKVIDTISKTYFTKIEIEHMKYIGLVGYPESPVVAIKAKRSVR